MVSAPSTGQRLATTGRQRGDRRVALRSREPAHAIARFLAGEAGSRRDRPAPASACRPSRSSSSRRRGDADASRIEGSRLGSDGGDGSGGEIHTLGFLPRFFRRARNIGRAPPISQHAPSAVPGPGEVVAGPRTARDRGLGVLLLPSVAHRRPISTARQPPAAAIRRVARRPARSSTRPPGTTDVPSNLAAIVARLPAAIAIGERDVSPAPVGRRQRSGQRRARRRRRGRMPGRDRRQLLSRAAAAHAGAQRKLCLRAAVRCDGGRRHAGATGVIGAFDSAASADVTPPQVVDFAVSLAGPCATVRFSTDEAASAEVVVRADGGELVTEAGAGQTTFDLAVPFTGLAPGVPPRSCCA